MVVKTTYKRFKHDYYPTPPSCVSAILQKSYSEHNYIFTPERDNRTGVREVYKALDVGAGTGIWGKVLKKTFPKLPIQLWGLDIQPFPKPAEYDYWLSGTDFLSEQRNLLLTDDSFDLVMGNPPFKHAEKFVRRSLDLTKYGGYVIMLTRLAFLESIGRATGLFEEHPPATVTVLARRPSFHLDRKTGSLAYCATVWQKGIHDAITELNWLNWNYDDKWEGIRQEAREHLIELGAFDEHLESKK